MRHLALAALLTLACCASAADRLKVCATTTDVAALTRAVGGDRIALTTFVRGGDDAHAVDARPSFVTALSRADVLVETGMELEVGWLPPVVQQSGNRSIAVGGPGRIDCSQAIARIVPTGTVDRSMGDMHAAGNPHYLNDPIDGLLVARLIRDRLSELDAGDRDTFAANYRAFATAFAQHLLGDAMVASMGAERAIAACESCAPDALPAGSEDAGGWIAQLRPLRGTALVADHDQWPYLARRFGLVIPLFLEPKPGVPPSSRHLQDVVAAMQRDHLGLILISPSFDAKHARVVADATGARIAAMAHQPGSRPGTDDYLAFIDYNVGQLVAQPAAR